MQSMAKKQPPDTPPDDSPTRIRSGENLNVWIRDDIYEALRRYLEGTTPRVTKTAAVEAALMEFLVTRKQWPRTG
jgi:hypothetical protein